MNAIHEPVRTLLRAGAEAGMVEDFRALADATAPDGSSRYRTHPVLADLARFLVRGGGGPNRDAAFYELCHLVYAVDAAGAAADRRNAFFLAPEQASAGRFKARLHDMLAKGGWRRSGFQNTGEGLSIQYPGGTFAVCFARMPFLAALYEFLAGMEDFAFYADLQSTLDGMGQGAHDLKTVQAASNRIAARVRQYRRRYLASTQQEGKFDVILGFLRARAPEQTISVDDAAVLDFWAQRSTGGDFRSYRTVFEAFVHFLRAFDEAARAEALAYAAPIGTDREAGEVEPQAGEGVPDDCESWTSPLALLDDGPAAEIKFLKKDSERAPLEVLMRFGPMARRLPLAFLRLESFGPVQSGITTDLQVGRARFAERIACTEARTYAGIVADFAAARENVVRLQKAAFYALHRHLYGTSGQATAGNIIALRAPATSDLLDQARADVIEEGPDVEVIDRLAAEAARTFRSIARKGFDEAGLESDARREGFRTGAAVLIAVAGQIEAYLAAAGKIPREGRTLEGWFDADRRIFSTTFNALYGGGS